MIVEVKHDLELDPMGVFRTQNIEKYRSFVILFQKMKRTHSNIKAKLRDFVEFCGFHRKYELYLITKYQSDCELAVMNQHASNLHHIIAFLAILFPDACEKTEIYEVLKAVMFILLHLAARKLFDPYILTFLHSDAYQL